ncbi:MULTISPECIES: hypothetical protein [unclassified Caballeronia]|uniref:hypothetical protein n=1 Tax=unclassified Caballeronia TaxID=2646786 RepID=UPI002864D57A|nr:MULTISPECIES: hypothetical protein [unclassified Caballeronia]MDR5740330.1 hypothetical protein [Caballeronia sp. LZ016]MDR5808490.1 hypothetical protein [Caballeronia sp. LZ019]
MFQTMQKNAAPHHIANLNAYAHLGAPAAEADLLAQLQAASDNVLRLAGELHANADADADSLTEQHAIAQRLIGQLLAMPASQR